MTGPWRSYTDQERAEAVGRALAIGAKRAALELNIPRRTISSWLRSPTPGLQGAIVASADAINATLEAAATEGAASLLALIRDPKTPARVKVDAVGLALQQWTLSSGRATSRTESTVTTPRMTPEDREWTSRAWQEIEQLATMDDEQLQAWLLDDGLDIIRDQQRRIQAGPTDVG